MTQTQHTYQIHRLSRHGMVNTCVLYKPVSVNPNLRNKTNMISTNDTHLTLHTSGQTN